LPWQENIWQRFHSQLIQQRLAHAYLLCGEEGLGKKQFALAAAGLLLCSNPTSNGGCGQCKDCMLNASSTNPDLFRIAPLAPSKVLKIEQIRALNDFVGQTSHGGRRKVVVMEQTDALNISAANALLKTLEEPTATTVLLLISDNPGSLLATIRSRAQRILFKTPPTPIALAWLQENIEGQGDLPTLLNLAGGKPLLALELHEGEELEQRLNIQRAFVRVCEGKLDPVEFAAKSKGIDVELVMECLWQTTATLVKYLLCKDSALLATSEHRALAKALQLENNSANKALARLVYLNKAADDARKQIASSSNPNPQLVLESMMWRWSRLSA
jgi:DNA polymerase-3 subunit delta'